MLRFYINSIFLFVWLIGFSQVTDKELDSTNTLNNGIIQIDEHNVYKQRYGLRVGIDLSKPIRMLTDDSYQGIELVADFRVSHKLHLASEFGYEDKTTQEDYFNFTTNGSYVKLGVDWNTYDNWYGMENMIYFGFRLGYSVFSQSLNEYEIYTSNQYWKESNTGTLLDNYDGLNAQWSEILLGIKVELIRNIFLGGSVRLYYLINDNSSSVFPNLYIPGFNKVTDGSNFGVGYNYTVSYLIPIFKNNKPLTE